MLLLSIQKKVIIHILFLLLMCTGLEGGKHSLENSEEGSNKVPRLSMLSSDAVPSDDVPSDDAIGEEGSLLDFLCDVDLHYRCDLCENKFFTLKGHLNDHQKSVHEGVRYQCDQCEKFYLYKKHLVRHKKSEHEGVRYQCDQCKKNYAQQGALYSHQKSVHGCVKYQCDQCEKNYVWKKGLDNHKKAKHKDILVCEPCNPQDKIYNPQDENNAFDEALNEVIGFLNEPFEEDV